MSQALKIRLEALAESLIQAERDALPKILELGIDQQVSARNLLHYLALRCEDLRELQEMLHEAGLSSLANAESHILGQMGAILGHLGSSRLKAKNIPCDSRTGNALLRGNARQLFGEPAHPHMPSVMVTFDTDFAADPRKITDLLMAGMNVARINCAHDSAPVWIRMVETLRQAMALTGKSCKVYVDLAGPKIRTRIPGRADKKTQRIPLEEGQALWITEGGKPLSGGNGKGEAYLETSLPGLVPQLRAGDRVLFDDGLIEARVERVQPHEALLRVLRISSRKPFLKHEKGINLPDTPLDLSPLSEDDIAHLKAMAPFADIIGLSFVRAAGDIALLQQLIRETPGPHPAIVAKIETPEAVIHLPEILLQGLATPPFGVMIARGDLAVEIGFERMSEIQEEIMWICEAAHVPVIWATQVLETLNKSGVATRSEVTDAAHAVMAECVMINKGEHVLKVLTTLTDILLRSGAHHVKKRHTFRPLGIARSFFLPKVPHV